MKILTTALLLSLALPAIPAGPQVTRDDLPVVVTFRNLSTDGVRGDAVGAYVDGEVNVRAIMTGFKEGNLVLDTNDKRTDRGRRVLLDFPTGSGMSDGPADVFMPMRSVNLDGRDDLRTLLPGASVQKRLFINWTAGKTTYHLRWDGEGSAGFITVTCTGPATTNAAFGDTCGAWTFTALGTDLANL